MPGLALSITDAQGRVWRWSGDEPDAADAPIGLVFTTKIPGGFEAMSCKLPRDPARIWADLNL